MIAINKDGNSVSLEDTSDRKMEWDTHDTEVTGESQAEQLLENNGRSEAECPQKTSHTGHMILAVCT